MPIPAQANWKSLDRGIYVSAAMAICALVVAGFWPSYFFKLFSADPTVDRAGARDGALMTAWIALFVVQVLLVTMGRVDLHRRMGVLGFALLTLILIVAVPTTIVATEFGANAICPDLHCPAWLSVIAAFTEFITLGSPRSFLWASK